MERSERINCRSAFYFMAESAGPEEESRYSLGDPAIRDLMRRIAARGHEVGLHPGFGTHLDARRIAAEFRRLRQTADELGIRQERWGGRQHYLCWRNPQTWRAWEDVGLDYDSSVGFPERVGFRAGMCCEYPVFDLVAGRELRLTERPLVAMDVTLWSYMNLTAEGALEQLRDLAAVCRSYRGEFCVLVHNNYLASTARRRAYDRWLDALS